MSYILYIIIIMLVIIIIIIIINYNYNYYNNTYYRLYLYIYNKYTFLTYIICRYIWSHSSSYRIVNIGQKIVLYFNYK